MGASVLNLRRCCQVIEVVGGSLIAEAILYTCTSTFNAIDKSSHYCFNSLLLAHYAAPKWV